MIKSIKLPNAMLNRTLAPIFIGLVLMSCGKEAAPPEEKEALDALKKVDAQISVGTNQIDYVKSVGEVKFSVEKFLETDYAKKRPEISTPMSSVLNNHLLAAQAWTECSIDEQRPFEGFCWDKRMPSFQQILAKYPDIAAKEEFKQTHPLNPGYFWNRDGLIKEVWHKNTTELQKIETSLK